MDKLIENILLNDQVISSLVTLLLACVGYLVVKVNKLKADTEANVETRNLQIESLKRSALRNEYLGIYNSTEFTYEQKYGMTRDIIASYKKLKGNHYISTLDKDLKEKAENEVTLTNKDEGETNGNPI